ncbi:MAG: nitronate monooxygenase [Bacteroidetes bacterium]|nr:MAG: nitronate monooxygenase [Bacteroidota bacterium]
MTFPQIIQGGMGVAVSGWQLALSVSKRGQIGVVSGTALDLVITRRLQLGDPGGHLRRALAAFPNQDIANYVADRYFIEGGKAPDKPYKSKPIIDHNPRRRAQELLVVSNFVEVFLAKEGHDGLVGINYLHKIQTPTMPSIYGAILAGVDIIIVGAGIPLEIPGIIDRLVQHEPVEMKLHVKTTEGTRIDRITFDPKLIFEESRPPEKRPSFFPIVSSATLATLMVKKCDGGVNGLIIEGPTAGGHNAPPRGRPNLNEIGEPIYGPRDDIDLDSIGSHGIPFFLAGSYGSPDGLVRARAAGAAGIQVGTLFAFCEESGLRPDLKHETIAKCKAGTASVFTDPIASPTGFPFKVLSMAGTASEEDVYESRSRVCDLSYLREAFEKEDGTIGWRCSADDEKMYVRNRGKFEDTVGRKCLCNGLMANIGMGQLRKNNVEEVPLLTCGDGVSSILKIIKPGESTYSSSDVIDFLLNGSESSMTARATAHQATS